MSQLRNQKGFLLMAFLFVNQTWSKSEERAFKTRVCWDETRALQKREVIYQTRATVFHQDIQTPRRELKIRRAAEYF